MYNSILEKDAVPGETPFSGIEHAARFLPSLISGLQKTNTKQVNLDLLRNWEIIVYSELHGSGLLDSDIKFSQLERAISEVAVHLDAGQSQIVISTLEQLLKHQDANGNSV